MNINVERFNLKKLNIMEVKEQCQVKILGGGGSLALWPQTGIQ
jgi:hypothetical protein